MTSRTERVAVIGGGIIGLSCGWALARAGLQVTVYSADPHAAASHAAAGMIAPASEAVFGQEALLMAGLASARLWPDFAADLARAAGHPNLLSPHGTLVVAADAGDEAALTRHARLLERHHCRVERLSHRTVRRLEPALSPRLAGGLLLEDEASVDPRAVTRALRVAVAAAGGVVKDIAARPRVVGGSVVGVELAPSLPQLAASPPQLAPADMVVAAAGWQTPELLAPLGVEVPVRPVKGQVIRVRAQPGVLHRTVRATVHGREVYLVPRSTGEVVIGATTEDVGPDTDITAGGIHDLLHDAIEVVPELAEARVLETMARLRPATPDNLPIIGGASPVIDNLFVAAGHGRDGVLLAPLTAELIVSELLGRERPLVATSFDPQRFSPAKEPA